eukprot:115673-Amphidinium_carterae.2
MPSTPGMGRRFKCYQVAFEVHTRLDRCQREASLPTSGDGKRWNDHVFHSSAAFFGVPFGFRVDQFRRFAPAPLNHRLAKTVPLCKTAKVTLTPLPSPQRTCDSKRHKVADSNCDQTANTANHACPFHRHTS